MTEDIEDIAVTVNGPQSARVTRRTVFGETVAALLGAPALATDVFRPSGMAIARAQDASSQKNLPRDGVASLTQLLRLRGDLARLMRQAERDGRFTMVEIDDKKPDARTEPSGSGRYVVKITSGMLDVIYAFGMALGGSVAMLNPDGTNEKPAVGEDEVSRAAADVLQNWQRYSSPYLWDPLFRTPWRDRKIFSLGRSALTIQEQIIAPTCLSSVMSWATSP